MINTCRISGTLHDIKHIALKSGVGQAATLWYDLEGHHIMVWAHPRLKVALNDGDRILAVGRLVGNTLNLVEVHPHDTD